MNNSNISDIFELSFMDFDFNEVARNGCFSILNLALDNLELYRYDVNSQDSKGNTLLHYAAEKGSLETVQKVISNHQGYVDILNAKGETPLHLACQHDQYDVAIFLIKQRARINAKDYFGESPLFKAVKKDCREISDYLVKQGADIKCKNHVGDSLLHLAAKINHKKLAEILLANQEDRNCINLSGDSPLQIALKENSQEVFEFLLNCDADFRGTDHQKCTLIHLAVKYNRIDILRVILSRNPDLNTQDANGLTALHLAAELNHTEIMKLLLETGANVDLPDVDGYTPLHAAASKKSNGNAVEILLKNNAKIDTLTDNCDLALHRAACSGNEKAVMLLACKKNFNLRNKAGYTAEMLAKVNNRIAIVHLLEHLALTETNKKMKRVTFSGHPLSEVKTTLKMGGP